MQQQHEADGYLHKKIIIKKNSVLQNLEYNFLRVAVTFKLIIHFKTRRTNEICIKCHIKINLGGGLRADIQHRTNHLHHINDEDFERGLMLHFDFGRAGRETERAPEQQVCEDTTDAVCVRDKVLKGRCSHSLHTPAVLTHSFR